MSTITLHPGAVVRSGAAAPGTGRRVLRVAAAAATVVLTAAFVAAGTLVFVLHLRFQTVLSGSMRPAFAPGAVIVTEPVAVSQLRVGMIVVFEPPGEHQAYAHRIVALSGPAADPVITTKGDANPVPDPWRVHLTGTTVPRVIVAVPEAGRLWAALRSHLVALAVAVVGISIAVAGTRAILRGGSARPALVSTADVPTTGSPGVTNVPTTGGSHVVRLVADGAEEQITIILPPRWTGAEVAGSATRRAAGARCGFTPTNGQRAHCPVAKGTSR